MKVASFILFSSSSASLFGGWFGGKKKEVVIKTEILREKGCKRKTKNGDQLFVHFWGMKTIGGDVFHTTWTDRFKDDKIAVYNKPYRFQLGLGEVIDGWEMGLKNMCPGERRRLFIPADLAYGEKGGGTPEMPAGDVIYDVELVHAEQGPRHPGKRLVHSGVTKRFSRSSKVKLRALNKKFLI
jgi:hypothetical protein